MTAGLSLVPIAVTQFGRVAHIAVHPDQVRFSGTVRQAFDRKEPGVDFHAICVAGRSVGFFKIDHNYSEKHWFARRGEPGLRAFMIDKDHQGLGIASGAVRAFGDYLPAQYPAIPSLVLTVNMANPAAVRVYRGGGFVDTGEIWEGGMAGPQLVMRLPLKG